MRIARAQGPKPRIGAGAGARKAALELTRARLVLAGILAAEMIALVALCAERADVLG